MTLQENDIQLLEALLSDVNLEIHFFSIEFSNGEKLEISR